MGLNRPTSVLKKGKRHNVAGLVTPPDLVEAFAMNDVQHTHVILLGPATPATSSFAPLTLSKHNDLP